MERIGLRSVGVEIEEEGFGVFAIDVNVKRVCTQRQCGKNGVDLENSQEERGNFSLISSLKRSSIFSLTSSSASSGCRNS